MSTGNVKQRVVEAMKALPDDATVEDATERLYFLGKVERGLDEARSGRSVSHEEIAHRVKLPRDISGQDLAKALERYG